VGIARGLGCLECLGRLSWMPWESSEISEIVRVTSVRSIYLRTDDPVVRSIRLVQYDISSTTIRSDGDYSLWGIPLRLDSTIRFGMAVDAPSDSEATYLTTVRYYLANLGTTMESQVRSSVSSVFLSPYLSVGCRHSTSRRNPLLFASLFSPAPRCVPCVPPRVRHDALKKELHRTWSLPALAGPYLGRDIRSNFLLNPGRLSTSGRLERNTNVKSERRTLPTNHKMMTGTDALLARFRRPLTRDSQKHNSTTSGLSSARTTDASQRQYRTHIRRTCYQCCQEGHYARDCPRATTPRPTETRIEKMRLLLKSMTPTE